MYRSSKMRFVRRMAGNLAVAVVTLTSGVAITYAMAQHSHPASTSALSAPTTSTTAAPVPTTAAPSRAALVSSVTPVSGVVTSMSGSSLTIRTTTGNSQTYSTNASTIVMQGRVKTTLASVHVGTRVFVVPSSTTPSLATAIGIVALSPGEGSDGAEGSDGN